ncbi:MAG: hydrogenase maturation nickel metallochaperone HypA [Candidatus Omnitrophica bacterium CG02_land_8_20_14_3_00__42_8]|nr:MAG: hydrogenase maturation nickel metallochaperone HypA [Candidatus Omnitrophica bacterium CG02_land_8_20_14_3_00__42_8]PIW68562.1 MAG: hydrogenase maturation nickel metallochaperone HypA [Candidatus Omnitrophica bacterium CG12_big_fil_rev_8_21_14_0_65_42_8]
MHEYHIVEGVVKQILEKAKSSDAKKITTVTLVLGELSGLQEESIRVYFENLSKDNILAGAKLIVKPVKSKLKCKDCGTIFEHEKSDFNCPKCSGLGVLASSGKEFYIDNIEIES